MLSLHTTKVTSAEQVKLAYAELGYICSDEVSMALYLAIQLQKPILVEGPPGVGKTELAKVTAKYLDSTLLRLQCYEGLDESKALYEWKYGKQLLYTQLLKDQFTQVMNGVEGLHDSVERLHQFGDVFYSPQFLEPRPVLQALQAEQGAVLLIDEIDKADQEFEAFLLEMLSDYQVSLPEIGTVKAKTTPIVILTSNNTRELGDALKRRCLHLYIPFPEAELEQQIIASQVPELDAALREQLVTFVDALRELPLKKQPAVSESIDWAKTLLLLNAKQLDEQWVRQTLNVLLKFQDDIENVEPEIASLLRGIA